MLTGKKVLSSVPEIWGGIECTINRVRDTYTDQLELSGHYNREEDISVLASLGIKKLRYPILWEKHQPNLDQAIDWSSTEARINQIIDAGITPIAGLLHHGSGPLFTNLLDEKFPELFAAYAAKVAEKFPFLEYYTPINEPLTTARFSGLYGFWYPHKKSDVSFAKMFLNQMKGIILAMKAIRRINPDAKLVQTEDLGKTYSTPFLHYQANFENQRRWLTYDLLCGKLVPDHSMFEYFIRLGIGKEALDFFKNNPCPPDIMGMNYYVTSERFLDENIDKYESYTHGGNELHTYADVEAVRANHNNPSGIKVLLKEAWDKYGITLAVTEVHINCTRDEQIRWFKYIWDSCKEALNEEVAIKAITAWSLLGAFGWNKLLTSEDKEYEPGVFDTRSGKLRPTALSTYIKNLSENEEHSHPVTKQSGWWAKKKSEADEMVSPVLILGKTGTLGTAFAHICKQRRLPYQLCSRHEVDITKAEDIEAIIEKHRPWAIINATGYVNVDEAEANSLLCFDCNTTGPALLAKACNNHRIKLLTFSSDLVFDGTKRKPYVESDKVNPLNAYGRSKAYAEKKIMDCDPQAIIVRTSSFFGPWDNYNFVSQVINNLTSEQKLVAPNDVFISPTYVPDLVNTSLDLLIDDVSGIWHITTGSELSWGELALKVTHACGLNPALLDIRPVDYIHWKARRPLYSVMKSEKGIVIPSLDDALNRFFADRKKVNSLITS